MLFLMEGTDPDEPKNPYKVIGIFKIKRLE
jgi:hypothetical protein